MKRTSAVSRIAFSLAGLTVSLLLFANLLGAFPDRTTLAFESRTDLVEAIALTYCAQPENSGSDAMRDALTAIVARNPEMLSLGVRREDNRLLVDIGNHDENWTPASGHTSTATALQVPLASQGRHWGSVEARFVSPVPAGIPEWLMIPSVMIALGGGISTFIIYFVYLRFVLRQLNPSRVIPKRVNEALNTLAEGLLVLDTNERIVLANTAFADATGEEPDALLGRSVSELGWHSSENRDGPWTVSMEEGRAETGILMNLMASEEDERTYSVNSVPICDDAGNRRGVLASFEDVTVLENKKLELSRLVKQLRSTAKQVNLQNRELERLATRDPLTDCLNRRAFFEKFESAWRGAEESDEPLSCVMVDIDHFKSVNDNHGHSMGDEVLERVGGLLLEHGREMDLVCRYGGEEFTVVMPNTDLDGATQAAERIREAVAALQFDKLSLTASLGVSSRSLGAADPQVLLDEADACLYNSKRSGRNRVSRWDDPATQEAHGAAAETAEPSDPAPQEETEAVVEPTAIPYHAVTALVAALSYRDRATAEHSRRVADLCVLIGEDLISRRECYVLETAGLLHDIGKVGVPDSILLKPGPLTASEWEVMHKHDRIGTEIIRASFACEELSAIIETHHAFYDGAQSPGLPRGTAIPLGARILSIADTYDAIVSDRVYRKGRSPEVAFAELRRCAGTQFDPELVEVFVNKMQARSTERIESDRVSKETALSIGLQIEQLVAALDDRDLGRLDQLTARLRATALEHRVDHVAEKATELQSKLHTREDLIDILYTAGELLECCRSTQVSYLHRGESEHAADVDEGENTQESAAVCEPAPAG